MRTIVSLLIAIIAIASASTLHDYCGTSSCPTSPAVIACNNDVCYSNSVDEAAEANSVVRTADPLFADWSAPAPAVPLREVREIFPFSNGAVLVGGYNHNRKSGLFYSPDGKQEYAPVASFPVIGSLRRVRPPASNNEAYVLGIATGSRFEQVAAIAVTPEGETQTWDFPFGFVVRYGHPHVLHSVKEGIWLAATTRPNDSPVPTLFRSADYGKTWEDVARDKVDFYDVTCCPGGGLCAAVGATSTAGVIYVSKDGGKSFQKSVEVPATPYMSIPRIRVTHKTETIIVTTCRGADPSDCTGSAFYSRDQGDSWVTVEASSGHDLRGMEAGPDGESVFIAGVNAKGFGTYSVIQFNETSLFY